MNVVLWIFGASHLLRVFKFIIVISNVLTLTVIVEILHLCHVLFLIFSVLSVVVVDQALARVFYKLTGNLATDKLLPRIPLMLFILVTTAREVTTIVEL